MSNNQPNILHSTTIQSNAITASCVSSGNIVVLGLRHYDAINCAGMALMRVFQGHIQVFGYQPPLGIYTAIYSPRWDSLLSIAPLKPSEDESSMIGLQAPFHALNVRLLELTEPSILINELDFDEEHAADVIAQQIAENFPIVLVFHALPVTYGNVACYYEQIQKNYDTEPLFVLPGFKLLVPKTQENIENNQNAINSLKDHAKYLAELNHDWKSVERTLVEMTVVDAFRSVHLTPRWIGLVDELVQQLLQEKSQVTTNESQPSKRQQRIIVCGAKSVGKSTFCRYLINKLLKRFPVVGLLDTDLGQPELTPPGLVSLHVITSPLLGPSFTHLRTPQTAYFCGCAQPSLNPIYYINAVKDLLQKADAIWASADIPLIVNTHGWIKGMGHDLLCQVIEDTMPQHVVQLVATTKAKQFPIPQNASWTIHQVMPWEIDAVSSFKDSLNDETSNSSVGTINAFVRGSKDQRIYRWHAYFLSHQLWDQPRQQMQNLHQITEKRYLHDQLVTGYCKMIPYALRFDQIGICFAGSQVPTTQILYSLNGSLVGLCIDAQFQQRREEATSNEISGERRILLYHEHLHIPCLGVGLIRGIDMDKHTLLILSPLPLETLQKINVLIRGTMSLDGIVFNTNDQIEEVVDSPYISTKCLSTDGSGASIMKSRNSVKRKRDG